MVESLNVPTMVVRVTEESSTIRAELRESFSDDPQPGARSAE